MPTQNTEQANVPSAKEFPPLLSLRESAAVTGLKYHTIRAYIRTGRLLAYRIGPRSVRVDRDSLLSLLKPIGGAA
jgi:excisionase family DNA binding protein